MTALKWLLILAVVGYGGLLALMYVFQRALLYFPDPTRVAPAQAGLPQAQEVTLTSADGEKLIAWFVPARGDKPMVHLFPGQCRGLKRPRRSLHLVDRRRHRPAGACAIAAMAARPARRPKLVSSATRRAAYDFAARALSGQAHRAVRRSRSAPAWRSRSPPTMRSAALILDAPFTSIADVGAAALSVRAGALADEGHVSIPTSASAAYRRRCWCCMASRTASCRSGLAKSCSRWRASPSAWCASRKAATSISTTTARPKSSGNF